MQENFKKFFEETTTKLGMNKPQKCDYSEHYSYKINCIKETETLFDDVEYEYIIDVMSYDSIGCITHEEASLISFHSPDKIPEIIDELKRKMVISNG